MTGLPNALAGRRVLVVDDEPYIQKILSFKLRLTGLDPVEASSGEEALRLVREAEPHLVLLDVSLTPGLTGFDVCRILKENPATAGIPIIMLTARTLPAERDLGLRLGAASYVTKPFSTKVLVQEIEKALS
ncbi:MAG: response regulator [Acidobacteria bacterium]|jgi:DNA-binding response OmpR family regulator|nr:response regulator [Acidobacteriota bacterium]